MHIFHITEDESYIAWKVLMWFLGKCLAILRSILCSPLSSATFHNRSVTEDLMTEALKMMKKQKMTNDRSLYDHILCDLCSIQCYIFLCIAFLFTFIKATAICICKAIIFRSRIGVMGNKQWKHQNMNENIGYGCSCLRVCCIQTFFIALPFLYWINIWTIATFWEKQ